MYKKDRSVKTWQRNRETSHSWSTLLPPPPRWIEVKLCHHECSRLLLVYQASDHLLARGLVGLDNIVGVNATAHHQTPLLPLPASDRRQFGIMALQESGLFVPGAGRLVSARWVFALEWVKKLSAWEALLSTLDHLPSPVFTLLPEHVVPAFFVARMADHSHDGVLETIATWGPVLNETYRHLAPLLLALYHQWIHGPSQTADRYRQFVEILPTDGTANQYLLAPFTKLVGPATPEALRTTERLEPTLIRSLEQISATLWEKETRRVREKNASLFLSTPHLCALLALALWHPATPAALYVESAPLHSLSDVLQRWKQHQGIE